MKNILKAGTTAASFLLLTACASSSSRFVQEDKFAIDHEYVAVVEQTGNRKGVRIMWVNPPTVRNAVESDISN